MTCVGPLVQLIGGVGVAGLLDALPHRRRIPSDESDDARDSFRAHHAHNVLEVFGDGLANKTDPIFPLIQERGLNRESRHFRVHSLQDIADIWSRASNADSLHHFFCREFGEVRVQRADPEDERCARQLPKR